MIAEVELPAVMSMLPALSAPKAGAAGKGPAHSTLIPFSDSAFFQRAAGFGERDVVGAPQPADPHDVLGGLNGG